MSQRDWASFPKAWSRQVGCAQDTSHGGHRAPTEENQLCCWKTSGGECLPAGVSQHWHSRHPGLDASLIWDLSCALGGVQQHPWPPPTTCCSIRLPPDYDNQKCLQTWPNVAYIENHCSKCWKSHSDWRFPWEELDHVTNCNKPLSPSVSKSSVDMG